MSLKKKILKNELVRINCIGKKIVHFLLDGSAQVLLLPLNSKLMKMRSKTKYEKNSGQLQIIKYILFS